MESLGIEKFGFMSNSVLSVFNQKNVLVTGSTGFKGSWMCQWLLNLGAKVYGYSLEPPTNPALYDQLKLVNQIDQHIGDINNYEEFKAYIQKSKPDIVFHLAAQALVRDSYIKPLETFQTNVMGTAHLLQAVKELELSTTIVTVTSDKAYENKEWLFGYREIDEFGGYDPYSASKGSAEIAISSWKRSFFHPERYAEHGVKITSVRAGNVIGGGDWAKDRIVPDCIRFLTKDQPIKVRNPYATRPWQHVLEPLGGYLLVGGKLLKADEKEVDKYDTFNFGPLITSNKNVESLVTEIIKNWGSGTWDYNKEEALHEASLLNLTIDKAYHILGWIPVWDFESTVARTTEWYKVNHENPEKIIELTHSQIEEYSKDFDSIRKA
ncbi:MAG: CDP-glucose 4,6-dehydratase [Cytophagales bacterium]|nr:CDP-glucose 4,6-dehydratase [Cytophagales bacterium]